MTYLFFDIETTGLPKKGAKKGVVKDWPHIVQLAWIICQKDGRKVSAQCYIAKPVGYVISEEVAKIHRVTHERAEKEGIEIGEILKKIYDDMISSELVVCHNTDFDINVLNHEFLRQDMLDNVLALKGKKIMCTMKETKDFCVIGPKKFGDWKYPKLEELHMKLFGEKLIDAHDALVDTEYLVKCFYDGVKRGIIVVNIDPSDYWITFGKYSGWNLMNLWMSTDVGGKDYIRWMVQQKWFRKKHYKMYRACIDLLCS